MRSMGSLGLKRSSSSSFFFFFFFFLSTSYYCTFIFDWADDQADLSLRWVHMPFCWFCHEAAHFMFLVAPCSRVKHCDHLDWGRELVYMLIVCLFLSYDVADESVIKPCIKK